MPFHVKRRKGRQRDPQVVLELIYRLKIRDVMTKPPISASPSDTMRRIQYRLRDNHITGLGISEAVEAELGDTGRVLIRASGTEPLLRVMVEARDEHQALACAQRLVDAVKAG